MFKTEVCFNLFNVIKLFFVMVSHNFVIGMQMQAMHQFGNNQRGFGGPPQPQRQGGRRGNRGGGGGGGGFRNSRFDHNQRNPNNQNSQGGQRPNNEVSNISGHKINTSYQFTLTALEWTSSYDIKRV